MGQVFGALVRAVLVAVAVALPSALLPGVQPDVAPVVVLFALFAGTLTLVEYATRYPGLVEFRYAPPYNRLRFFMVVATLLLLSYLIRAETQPGTFADFVAALGAMVGGWLDFAYSPVRLMLLTLPPTATAAEVAGLRAAAALGALVALFTLALFALWLALAQWPARRSTFNVWVNLPTFDPTTGGDVVDRLERDARVNLILGCLLPFLFPATLLVSAPMLGPLSESGPQTRIWVMTAWAVLPASLVMRGVALARIARMIRALRQREDAASPPGLQAV